MNFQRIRKATPSNSTRNGQTKAAIATSKLLLVAAVVVIAAVSLAYTVIASTPQATSSTTIASTTACTGQPYGVSQCSSTSTSTAVDTSSTSSAAATTSSSQATSTGSTPSKTVTVTIVAGAHNSAQQNNFVPSTIIVVLGYNNTVSWINNDSSPHTVTSDSGAFNSGTINPSGTFSYTFTTAGVYTYHCSIHPFMKGTIEVVSAA